MSYWKCNCTYMYMACQISGRLECFPEIVFLKILYAVTSQNYSYITITISRLQYDNKVVYSTVVHNMLVYLCHLLR